MDRFVGYLNPEAGANRMYNRRLMNGLESGRIKPEAFHQYDAASNSRMRTKHAFGRSRGVDEDRGTRPFDRNRMGLEAMDMYRNNEIFSGVIDRFVRYVIYKGIWPQARTSSNDWNTEAEQFWREVYIPTADHRAINGIDGVTLQEYLLRGRFLSGDMGYLLLKNGQQQAIEGERIVTPAKLRSDKTVRNGVKVDAKGIVRGYYISPRGKGGSVDQSKFKFVNKRDFIYCYKPFRPDQLRGIPEAAVVINKVIDYDETDEAVVNKIKADARQQFSKKKEKTSLPGGRGSGQLIDSSGRIKPVEELLWGTVHNLAPNEVMEAFGSLTPNGQYVPFMKHELQVIAMAFDIPYELMMMIFTSGSFSSQKAAQLHAKHSFEFIHSWIVKVYLQRVWNWRIAIAIKNNQLPPAPVDKRGRSEWFKTDWSSIFLPELDPKAQATADKDNYNLGKTSLKSIIRSEGRDRDDVIREKGGDISAAIKEAAAINKEHPEAGVIWRDIIASGVTAQVSSVEPDPDDDDDDPAPLPTNPEDDTA